MERGNQHTRPIAGAIDSDDAATHSEAALAAVRQEAAGCRACPLWGTATQTVFGVGTAHARLMFIAEAPGEHEDKHGVPFVGPAGILLDQALDVAGIDRNDVFITNVVKHRPWIQQGPRRKNRAPRQSEINACRPWLESELEIVSPEIIVCLGAPAAHAILGKAFRLTDQRGQWFSAEAAPNVLATIHPAYVLIQPDESRAYWRDILFGDFAQIGERFRALDGAPAQSRSALAS